MTTTTTNYTVRRYSDNQAIGRIDLTAEQFSHYEQLAQQPQGLIRLGDKATSQFYTLDAEYQDLGPDTTVYLD